MGEYVVITQSHDIYIYITVSNQSPSSINRKHILHTTNPINQYSKRIITYNPTNPTINPAIARHPHIVQGFTVPAALAPLEPAATQSFHAACISMTKAWASGLSLPC